MTEDTPPYHLDIEGLEDATPEARTRALRDRPWLGIHFECCGVYTRVYRNRDGTAYDGCCPNCTRRVHIGVGPGGDDTRFFTAR